MSPVKKSTKEARANLHLNTYKPQKDGTCPISLRVVYRGERRYYPIGKAMLPAAFDSIKSSRDGGGKVNPKFKKYSGIYDDARKHLIKAEESIERLNRKIFTFGLFEQDFLQGEGPTELIESGFDHYISELKAEGRIGTAVTYECARNSLEEFRPGMSFADITSKTLKDYERKMIEAGKSQTTVGIYLRSLRTIFNVADVDKVLYPFGKGRNKYTIPAGRNLKKALTPSEIAKIFNYQAEQGSREEWAKDYWIFLYLCNGMNVKDLCRLKWKNIHGNILSFKRAKTERSRREVKEINVSLKPEALAILNRYGLHSVSPESYIFPHFEIGITPEDERQVTQSLIETINDGLKKVARDVKLGKELTTGWARHSFATMMKWGGNSDEMISELLGHSSTQVTRNYLDSFQQDQINKATDVLTAFK